MELLNLGLQSRSGELRGGINSQRASQAMPVPQCQPQGNPQSEKSTLLPTEDQEFCPQGQVHSSESKEFDMDTTGVR